MTISCSLKNRLNTLELNGKVCGGCVLPCLLGGRTLRMCTRRLASLRPTSLEKKVLLALSLYIDDRLNGELFTKKGFWSRPIGQRDTGYSYKSAQAALYIVCKVLTHLGYFLSLKKCVLAPTQRILYLGMLIDSTLQAFLIPEEKKEKFASLRQGILIHKSLIPLNYLQRLMGKCISFSLACPGAKFYTREMAQAVGRAFPKREIQLTAGLRENKL